METDLRVESGSTIRVAIVAIGEMPATQLRDYVAMLVQYTRIPLAILSPYYTEHQKSPFAQQPWETGSLLLKFLVGGAERSRWEDFQAQRKILGVIGFFAFHPTDTQLAQADDKKKDFLAISSGMQELLKAMCVLLFWNGLG
ncbi:unnamed protein product [Sphagnum balticum]